MKKVFILLLLVILMCLVGHATARPLILSVSDPIGDQYGTSPDVISMDFLFDNETGDYAILLTTTDANPFIGDFRININLFNPDTGTTNPDPSMFSDTLNDFSLTTPTTTLILSGTKSRLLYWEIGDQVYINNFDTPSPANPHPDGVSYFRSAVYIDGVFENEDYLNQVTSTVYLDVIEVEIDIKPASDPNSINLASKGVIPVAILTTEDFDASTVDPLSVAFGANEAEEAHGKGHIEDVDEDGDLDLVLHFNIRETGIACGEEEAGLTGETFDGLAIEGFDSIRTVGCN